MKDQQKIAQEPSASPDTQSTLPGLEAFAEAFEILLEAGSETIEKLCTIPVSLERFVTMLRHSKGSGTIHITGMGRSGKVGMLFGELLKTEGFNVSYIGKTYARPVRFGDLAVGFSGSGWTKTTAYNLEDCIRVGAKVASFVGDPLSKVARLSDVLITIPSHSEGRKRPTSYVKRNIEGIAPPLTPMGTVFEITSMLVASGISACLEDTTISLPVADVFSRVCNQIIQQARLTKKYLEHTGSLQELIDELARKATHAYSHRTNKVYVLGTGMSGIVASMAAVRGQHVGINIQSEYDWRFRNQDDVLLAISGSGETSNILTYAQSAAVSGMKIMAITSFADSQLAQLADNVILVSGRKEKISEYDKEIWDSKSLVPSFEYSAAVVLDSIVAQIALSLKIDEESMKKEHANVQ
ncbi:MAG: SIS domain-containing protein [Candidatus Heimdallarchaeota archaeon]